MSPWLEALRRHDEAGSACVLVTLTATAGSSPREAGAKMVVSTDSAEGTLGGGTVELLAQQRARELLSAGEAGVRQEDFVLNDELDQACGGRMTLLFEPLYPPALQVAVFGAGHVGRALVHALEAVNCRIHWVDSREGQFPEVVPANVRCHTLPAPASIIPSLPAGTRLLAMSQSHELDLEVVAAALLRDDIPLVGTIGSATKRGRFLHRLREMGLGEAAAQRLVCPVGLPGVGGKAPGEIAIAVAAQLLATMRP